MSSTLERIQARVRAYAATHNAVASAVASYAVAEGKGPSTLISASSIANSTTTEMRGTTSALMPVTTTPATQNPVSPPIASPAKQDTPSGATLTKAEFLKALRHAAVAEDDLASDDIPETISSDVAAAVISTMGTEFDAPVYESFSLTITLNEKQELARETAFAGKSFCLIGAAGTGKTTTQRSVAKALLLDQKLSTTTFKIAGGGGERIEAPSIAFCAYTRRATANLRRAVHKDPELEEALKNNIITIHQLLEYEPETYFCPVDQKEKFRFVPRKTRNNPLTITHLIIEEASMLGLDLWEKLYDALPFGVQIIFIGDINQLPPVFGPSILNFALVQLPVVELTEVYRNQGIVLENAHRILNGEMPVEDAKWQIVRGKSDTQTGQEKMASSLGVMYEKLYNSRDSLGRRLYDPEDCMILTPFNVQPLGSDNMNKYIAQFLGMERKAIVHEVIAGFSKLYLAEGDRVMYDKRDAIITKITRNMKYYGKEPQQPGSDLSRFGVRILGAHIEGEMDVDFDELNLDYTNFDIDNLAEEKAERKIQCSHIVDLEFTDGGSTTLEGAGDFTPQIFSLGYVLTTHKAQGSEWRKVFIMLHKDHSVSLYREWFYTACTRPREEVTIFAKDFVIQKAVKNQRIKGRTLADKIAYFNSGVTNVQEVFCTK